MDRREFLSWVQGGLSGAALATLLSREAPARAGEPGEAKPPCPHFRPRATRAIHLCLCGAMSHLDTFDYKPDLIAAHGKPVNSSSKPDTFLRPDRPAAAAGLELQAARRERALGVGLVPEPCTSR